MSHGWHACRYFVPFVEHSKLSFWHSSKACKGHTSAMMPQNPLRRKCAASLSNSRDTFPEKTAESCHKSCQGQDWKINLVQSSCTPQQQGLHAKQALQEPNKRSWDWCAQQNQVSGPARTMDNTNIRSTEQSRSTGSAVDGSSRAVVCPPYC